MRVLTSYFQYEFSILYWFLIVVVKSKCQQGQHLLEFGGENPFSGLFQCREAALMPWLWFGIPLLPLLLFSPTTFISFHVPLTRTLVITLTTHLGKSGIVFPSQDLYVITPAKSLLSCSLTFEAPRH